MGRTGFGRTLQAEIDHGRQAGTHITKNGDIRTSVLADFGGIDLEMDHPGPRGKGVELASDPIIKASADGDEKVAVSDGKLA